MNKKPRKSAGLFFFEKNPKLLCFYFRLSKIPCQRKIPCTVFAYFVALHLANFIFLMKKSTLPILGCILLAGISQAQPFIYDNFEGGKSVHYTFKNGVLDSLAENPARDSTNTSSHCALYVRNSKKKFDNIKMSLHGKLKGVMDYATYEGIPPQLKMKVYTAAPVGTLVEILLGSHGRNNEYPAGTHSQYQAHTTKSNEWEVLTFKFSQIPDGSETKADEIDQVTLIFNPNTSTSDTYYFDDITGPVVNEQK